MEVAAAWNDGGMMMYGEDDIYDDIRSGWGCVIPLMLIFTIVAGVALAVYEIIQIIF